MDWNEMKWNAMPFAVGLMWRKTKTNKAKTAACLSRAGWTMMVTQSSPVHSTVDNSSFPICRRNRRPDSSESPRERRWIKINKYKRRWCYMNESLTPDKTKGACGAFFPLSAPEKDRSSASAGRLFVVIILYQLMARLYKGHRHCRPRERCCPASRPPARVCCLVVDCRPSEGNKPIPSWDQRSAALI